MESFLRGYSKKAPLEYVEFTLMREMGWTYKQLSETPASIVEYALEFMNAEAKQRERENKK